MRILSLCLAGWLALPAAPAHAQVQTTILHTFTGGTGDGQNPSGALLLSGSNFYGMTASGGSDGEGTIFTIGTNGAGFSVTHSFAGLPNDGGNPAGSLIQLGPFLYGMTESGGASNAGTVFRIAPNGSSLSLLHPFANGPGDGAAPFGTLLQSGSTFYGMTNSGGNVLNSNGNGTYENGTIFKIGTDGTGYAVLHSFAGAPGDGQLPGYGALVQSGSTLYGMTGSGGSADAGTIFKIGTDGTGYAVLHSFAGGAGDGRIPFASLIVSGSNLYGTTDQGGTAGAGTIFKIGTDGTGFSVMYSFTGGPADGANPQGDLLLVGSKLYGMTAGGGSDSLGTLFGIATDGTGYSVMHSFSGGSGDGAGPEGALILSGSTLYGMTSGGGGSNDGVVFSLPVPEPSSLVLVGAGGAVFLARWRAAP